MEGGGGSSSGNTALLTNLLLLSHSDTSGYTRPCRGPRETYPFFVGGVVSGDNMVAGFSIRNYKSFPE